MLLRDGKAGPFLSCSRYPECKKAMPLSTGVKCPKCGKGELAERRSKRGKTFYSCDQYPQCDYSLWNAPVEADCPNAKCGSKIMEKRHTQKSGNFLQCPECKEKLAIDEN
jgi:DNA topoisomerase-1